MNSSDASSSSRPHTDPAEPATQRRALVVWLAAVVVYIVAIMGRGSFGVASVEAFERFSISASGLAVFTAVQMGVYALSQIPTGVLIDRFGARRLLVAGALVMASGQLLLALSTSYAVAIGARVLVAMGDATAFLSVMRIIPQWFPLHRAPIFTQLTAALGQVGQFLSAVVFLGILHAAGWEVAFISLAAVGVLVALAAWVAIKEPPRRLVSSTQPLRARLATVATHPACWQGFFIHGIGLFPQVVFTLTWGMPLMTLGMGLSPQVAGWVLVVNTVVQVLAGPLHGVISARFGATRWMLALITSGATMALWAVFFLSSSPRGVVWIVAINVVMGALAPVANYGFDQVREAVPHEVLATGTGLANMGGFTAGMIVAQAYGMLLDVASTDSSSYTWDDFRFAGLAALIVWALGASALFWARSREKR
ncbi:D-galactonate transporter [Corynebacterium ciconiae DSM 44920]|uniref:MFS transporter n=1 Tax=Corynebacterium ciconiae TaxID=227319 RepID=UPI000360D177|nr:MFS transporter [Corynebacterium ciconiae]WKD60717.1 D-galactonate transporter [Corynebacterium ciconiae DSM 44920]